MLVSCPHSYFLTRCDKREYFDFVPKNNIGMSHIIAHIFHTRNISSTVFHRMYLYLHYSNFPRGKKKRRNDQKQVDDKKYACTQDRLRFTSK
jgi:hypothetical protein